MPFKGTALVVVGTICVSAAYHDPFCWKQKGSYCEMPWDLVHGHHDDHPIYWIGSPTSVIASTSGSSSNVVHLKAADFTIGSPVFDSPVLTVRSGPA
jgi:hypothetical protein